MSHHNILPEQLPRKQSFLEFEFDLLTLHEAVEIILEWVRDSASSQTAFRYVVTPNVAHVVTVSRDVEALRPLFDGATLCLCDSRILALGAEKAVGLTLPVVPGSDLTAALIPELAQKKVKIGIIGSSTADIDALCMRYPGLNVVHHEAPQGLRHSVHARRACIDFLVKERPSITFIAVGMPQQEMIAFEASQKEGLCGVGLCVGGSIDFLVGRQKRAPEWMQRNKIEWLYRLLSDPKRLAKRYILDFPPFVKLLLAARNDQK